MKRFPRQIHQACVILSGAASGRSVALDDRIPGSGCGGNGR